MVWACPKQLGQWLGDGRGFFVTYIEQLARLLGVLFPQKLYPALCEEALLVASALDPSCPCRRVLWRQKEAVDLTVRFKEGAQLVGVHVRRYAREIDDTRLLDGSIADDQIGLDQVLCDAGEL